MLFILTRGIFFNTCGQNGAVVSRPNCIHHIPTCSLWNLFRTEIPLANTSIMEFYFSFFFLSLLTMFSLFFFFLYDSIMNRSFCIFVKECMPKHLIIWIIRRWLTEEIKSLERARQFSTMEKYCARTFNRRTNDAACFDSLFFIVTGWLFEEYFNSSTAMCKFLFF